MSQSQILQYIRPQYDQQYATGHTNIHTAVECTVQWALWIRLNETFNLFVDLDQNSYSLETEGWVWRGHTSSYILIRANETQVSISEVFASHSSKTHRVWLASRLLTNHKTLTAVHFTAVVSSGTKVFWPLQRGIWKQLKPSCLFYSKRDYISALTQSCGTKIFFLKSPSE